MPIDPGVLAVFVAAGLALNLTPGPDMLYVLANGLGQGPRAGAVSALGVGGGCLVHTAAAALGLSVVLASSPLAFDAVRYLGAAYLGWLGLRVIRGPASREAVRSAPRARLSAVFWRGMATNVLNPKVALFFLAFLPQFVQPEKGSTALQIVFLGLIFNFTGTGVNIGVGVFSGELGRRLLQGAGLSRTMTWLSGLVFLGLAARLVISGRG